MRAVKNSYSTKGNVAVVYVERRNGDRLSILIDPGDLNRVREFRNTWCVQWSKNSQTFYVFGFVTNDGRREKIYLHRWLLTATPTEEIDHKNHNGLDNRRRNIRVATASSNGLNRRVTTFAVSGYRGVYPHRRKWIARLAGKYLGLLASPEEASRVVQKALAESAG
jgi:hypothetical protein